MNQIIDPNDRTFITKLLDETVYLDYQQFKDSLLHNFKTFSKSIKNKPFYILSSIHKETHSEDWILAILWPYLRYKNIMGFLLFSEDEDQVPDIITKPGTYDLVIFDDVSYSGGNIVAKIDILTYDLAKLLDIKTKELKSNGYHFIFHIVVPYLSSSSRKNISTMSDVTVKFYTKHNILVLDEIIDLKHYYGDHYDLGPGDISGYDRILYQKFNFEVPNGPLLYLDHKIASQSSTYPQIYRDGNIPVVDSKPRQYGNLLKELPSRYKIEELDNLFLEYTDGTRLVIHD